MTADNDHHDEWAPGLHFAGKTLSTKTVRRAADFWGVLPVVLSHVLRQGNEAHRHRSPIDPARRGANEVLRGPDSLSVVEELARNTLDGLGIVPRRADAVVGIELVFQPPDGHDTSEFWGECLAWTDSRYQCVLGAVVHRDQSRPHLHVVVLAVAGGKLAGHVLTSGPRQFPRQRVEFMRHVFDVLGLRPNRRAADPLKKLALTMGKGAKTHAAAARRDAKLTREAGADWRLAGECIAVAAGAVHSGPKVEGADRYAHENDRPLILRSVSTPESSHRNGAQTPVFGRPSAMPSKARRPAPKTADFWRAPKPPRVLDFGERIAP